MKKTIFWTFFAACIMMVSSVRAAGNNIAPDAIITASTKGGDGTSRLEAVNDGTYTSDGAGTTKWFIMTDVTSQWLQFNFAEPVTVSGALIISGGTASKPSQYVKDFKLVYMENDEWHDIPGAVITGNTSEQLRINFNKSITSDKIRFIPTSSSSLRIREFELYTPADDVILIEKKSEVPCPEDTVGTKYESSYKKLYGFGIFEGEEDKFYPEYHITRAEFTEWMMRLLGYKNFPDTEKNYYADVIPGTHEANVIAAAYEKGIIGKDLSTSFRPNDEITYNEACIMAVCALGYAMEAERKGGYPKGYMSSAAPLDLSKGIELRRDGYLNRGDCIIFLDNMLGCYTLIYTPYNGDSQYIYGDTLAEELYNCTETSGIIEADYLYSHEDTVLSQNEVIIDGEVYNTGRFDLYSMYGKSVKIYYTEEEGEKTIIWVEEKSNNSTLTINASDIEEADLNIVTYYSGTALKKVRISKDAVILLNGSTAGITAAALSPEYGGLYLVDNNGDGAYDFVRISSREISQVSAFDSDKNILYGKGVSWELNNYDKVVVLKDGEYTDTSVISAGEIISVEASADNKLLAVYLSDAFVEGKIQSVYTDEDEYKVVIDGIEYTLIKGMEKYALTGVYAKFFLTFDGIAAAAGDFLFPEYRYGFVMHYGIDDDDTGKLKVMKDDGSIECFDIEESCIINGSTVSARSMEGMFSAKPVIKYLVNSKNELKQILIAVSAGSMEYVPDSDNSLYEFTEAVNYGYYNGNVIDPNNERNIFPTDDTVVFSIPEGEDTGDESELRVVHGTKEFTTESLSGTIYVFNLKEGNVPEALYFVKKSSMQYLSQNAVPMVVRSVNKAINDDGEVLMQINGIENGTEVSYFETEDSVYTNEGNAFLNGVSYKNVLLSELKCGDVVQIKKDRDNVSVATYRVLYRADDLDKDGMLQYTGGSGNRLKFYPYIESISGRVNNIKNGIITIYDSSGQKYNYQYTSSNIYVCDTAKKRVSMGSADDIITAEADGMGSRVFVRVSGKAVYDIVIYE